MAIACKAIILGAGPPYRGLEPSLISETDNHWSVLDWLSDAFSVIDADIHLVGGYRFEEISRKYPNLPASVNVEWRDTGPVESLFMAPINRDCEHYVCYSDTVFSKTAVSRLAQAEGDIVLAADSAWLNRYGNRSPSDLESAEKVAANENLVLRVGCEIRRDQASAEFTGLMRLSQKAVSRLIEFRNTERSRFRNASMPTLVEAFIEDGFDIRWVDIGDNWAELNAPSDLSRFVLGTKAETLARLRPMVTKSSIGEQIAVTFGEWRSDQACCVERIAAQFLGEALIVRSSAVNEDGWNTANAGVFLSLLDVSGVDREAWIKAIEEVFGSYGDSNNSHQVLIQKMIVDVAISGVIFSRTLSFGGPYYTINYDETSAKSDTVTGGGGGRLKTLIVNRQASELPEDCNPRLAGLLPAVRELEALVAHDTLDLEFIIGSDGVVHVVQLRPIAVDHSRWRGGSDRQVNQLLEQARTSYRQHAKPGPFVLGQRSLYSNMTDWNPAEIIGTRPRPLAKSLYRRLITDDIWARQRAEYGYRDVRPQRLMTIFADQPYIDVRASFNSLVPASLDDQLAERLVEYYIDRLARFPALHDKIEFDIVFSCMTFDFENTSKRLYEFGFSSSEVQQLSDSLCEITSQGINRYKDDLKKIGHLIDRRQLIKDSELPDLDRALCLLEDCRYLGALPFAHLARAGFVAVSLLRSAVAAGVLDQGMSDSFMNSIETVATRFGREAWQVAKGERSWDQLVLDYGHLRPGTYEITSPCYRIAAESYLRPLVDSAGEMHSLGVTALAWQWPDEVRRGLDKSLAASGMDIDSGAFDAFARAAIEGREYAKFCFTRNLSDALESIATFGDSLGLDRECLSYIEYEDLTSLAGGTVPTDPAKWMKERARQSKNLHTLAHGVELPPLIANESDFAAFHYPETHPNFVSSGSISAATVCLNMHEQKDIDLKERIVLIPQADPGYDWLFGHPIVGLITAYGGANSHMAIRAAEFGIPAAIGVGERLYNSLAEAKIILLDCQNRQIEIVQ